MKFELHCHTRYSRGTKIPSEGLPSPAEVIQRAKNTGLSGIAITDHGNTRAWKEAKKEAEKQDIIFIPGMEVNTKNGHLVALGISEKVKNNLTLEETIEKIHEQEGLAIAVHPFDTRGMGVKHDMKKADAVEVFNALSLDKIPNMFAERMARKLGKVMVVGSDAHSLEMIGTANNIIHAHDMDSALREIKRGNVRIEKKYVPLKTMLDWIRYRFILSYENVFMYINNNYSPPKAWFSKKLIRKFVLSSSNAWNVLARIGISFTMLYSGFKVFTYC